MCRFPASFSRNEARRFNANQNSGGRLCRFCNSRLVPDFSECRITGHSAQGHVESEFGEQQTSSSRWHLLQRCNDDDAYAAIWVHHLPKLDRARRRYDDGSLRQPRTANSSFSRITLSDSGQGNTGSESRVIAWCNSLISVRQSSSVRSRGHSASSGSQQVIGSIPSSFPLCGGLPRVLDSQPTTLDPCARWPLASLYSIVTENDRHTVIDVKSRSYPLRTLGGACSTVGPCPLR